MRMSFPRPYIRHGRFRHLVAMGADPPRGTRGNAGKTGTQFWFVLEDCSMSLRSKDAAIDEIVASCSGDLRGAVRALLLINEHLEAELVRFYAAAADQSLVQRGNHILH